MGRQVEKEVVHKLTMSKSDCSCVTSVRGGMSSIACILLGPGLT